MRRLALALLALAACSDGTDCSTRTADIGEVCLPSALSAGIPTLIEVRELCGAGCSSAPTCAALNRNGQVVLEVEQDVCTAGFGSDCLSQGCQQRTALCQLPALQPGDWTLVVPGGPSRTVRVQDGGQSSCRFLLPDGGVQ